MHHQKLRCPIKACQSVLCLSTPNASVSPENTALWKCLLILLLLLLLRVASIARCCLLLQTEYRDLFMCLSIGHIRELCKKRLNRSRCRLVANLCGPRNHLLDGVEIILGRGNFWGCSAH